MIARPEQQVDGAGAARPRVLLHLAEYSPYPPGAFVRALLALAPAARQGGWATHLALPISREPRAWHGSLERAGWVLHFLPRPWGPRLVFARAVWSLLRALHPRVIHLHFSAPALPVIAAGPLESGGVRVMHWHNPPQVTAIPMVLADAIARPQHVAVSAGVAGAIARLHPGARGRLRVLPNAVAFPEGITPPRGTDLVTIAAFRTQKDPDTLLNALSLLSARGWDGVLHWIGTGPDEERVQARAQTAALRERIRFHGSVDDPSDLLRTAAVFVLSSHFEGQPYAVLEALAHGRPVVATDLPGVREILRGQAACWCAPPGDAAALAAKLADVLRDVDAAGNAARLLREDLRAEHSLETWTGRLLSWYEEWTGGEQREPETHGSGLGPPEAT
jgi:glycosyltransferase involved in cell wall biosynthesis